ncbi:hypothetical protein FG386_001149 [Cryptosporidium ryanae]|uniref:uncharacterized protein n=1 Tax=Cryptosporidium ryanae TaxID=515981 RepID=UPI00351A152F|nr:hypothetical protein FG386_001149 [Cryptosporidium ryanae]
MSHIYVCFLIFFTGLFAFYLVFVDGLVDLSKSDITESYSILMNSWTIGILVKLKLAVWTPLFDDIRDKKSFKETIELCINRGITPPQPPIFIRLLEFEHLTGLTGILIEFPKNKDTIRYINRERIVLFLKKCREDKLEGEVHIASNILLRNNPLVNNPKQKQADSAHRNEDDYTMATTFTITLLLVATTLSIISAYVIYSTVKNKK